MFRLAMDVAFDGRRWQRLRQKQPIHFFPPLTLEEARQVMAVMPVR